MNFLHSEFDGGSDCVALVTLDSQANAMLLSDCDFHSYRNGSSFHYYGGWATRSPVRLVPPHHGRWHIIVDLGGRSGTIRAGIRLIRRNSMAGVSM
jgi:hypothetical protein